MFLAEPYKDLRYLKIKKLLLKVFGQFKLAAIFWGSSYKPPLNYHIDWGPIEKSEHFIMMIIFKIADKITV